MFAILNFNFKYEILICIKLGNKISELTLSWREKFDALTYCKYASIYPCINFPLWKYNAFFSTWTFRIRALPYSVHIISDICSVHSDNEIYVTDCLLRLEFFKLKIHEYFWFSRYSCKMCGIMITLFLSTDEQFGYIFITRLIFRWMQSVLF
jgi:hypothetical protein